MELTTGHGRLLYIKNDVKNLTSWFDDLSTIDQYIEQGQKLNIAEDCCYLYFFSLDESENTYWCARGVIGHESYLPEGLSFFDYYDGPIIEKELDGTIVTVEALFSTARKLRESEPDLRHTAMTWRVKVAGIDHGKKTDKNSLIEMPKMTFQFFKSL